MTFTFKNLCNLAAALVLTACSCGQAFAKENFDDAYFLRYLKQNNFPVDPSAAAVVLYEKATVDISPDNGWMVSEHVHRIIKILKKEGLKEADVQVSVFHVKGSYSEIKKISGTTYNLENGVIREQDFARLIDEIPAVAHKLLAHLARMLRDAAPPER